MRRDRLPILVVGLLVAVVAAPGLAGPPTGGWLRTDSDPAFSRYVDLSLLGNAWREMDPARLADVALQFAEGERSLGRPHTMEGLRAESLLQKAVVLAARKGDKATLERLAEAADRHGNAALKARADAALKLGDGARAVDPAALVHPARTTPEAYALYRGLFEAIEAACLAGDRNALDEIEKQLDASADLSDTQREYLRRVISEGRTAVPEDQEPDPTVAVLDKLADASRWDPWERLTGKRAPTMGDIFGRRKPRPIVFAPKGTYVKIHNRTSRSLQINIVCQFSRKPHASKTKWAGPGEYAFFEVGASYGHALKEGSRHKIAIRAHDERGGYYGWGRYTGPGQMRGLEFKSRNEGPPSQHWNHLEYYLFDSDLRNSDYGGPGADEVPSGFRTHSGAPPTASSGSGRIVTEEGPPIPVRRSSQSGWKKPW